MEGNFKDVNPVKMQPVLECSPLGCSLCCIDISVRGQSRVRDPDHQKQSDVLGSSPYRQLCPVTGDKDLSWPLACRCRGRPAHGTGKETPALGVGPQPSRHSGHNIPKQQARTDQPKACTPADGIVSGLLASLRDSTFPW